MTKPFLAFVAVSIAGVAAASADTGITIPTVTIGNPGNEWLFDAQWGVDVSVSTPHLITGLVEEAVSVGAIELLRSGTSVDAIVSEIDLPEVTGPELLAWLEAEMPELADRVLFVTGAQDRPAFAEFVRQQSDRVLLKPVAPAKLRESLERVVNVRLG